MDSIDIKDLEQLAKVCRKAGIDSFKGYGVEFTLAASTPEPKKPRGKSVRKQPVDLGDNEIETDELSPEAMMFWSAPEPQETPSE